MEFLENKNILITGATGFLAKILVEKILGIQPNVKKLYLLLRAADETEAKKRFYNEVIEKDLFQVLRKKWGANLNTLISEKICLIPGEISLLQMGLKDSIWVDEMKNRVEIVINLAATTNFDERYDVALGTNTIGVEHVVRANLYGWPNTYVFTKAMGEMTIGDLKNDLPLIIIRPTIVTSTYKEPFPGWVEGVRTIDSIIVGYAKGKLTCFAAGTNSSLDLIPADIVVNTMIMAMVVHKDQPSDQTIYHVGSSARNSMTHIDLQRFSYQYFTQKPLIDKNGKAIKVGKVTLFNSMAKFHRYLAIRYLIFLKGLEFANIAFCHSFQDKYVDMRRKFNLVMRLIELYRPYLFFNAIFDDTNTERLRNDIRNKDTNEAFVMDPKDINWEDYFMNVHFPGLVKHVIR
ncbi:Fatty acyl-CoA reductase 3, partial [Cucurbita argyrosperma subsp. sororia]